MQQTQLLALVLPFFAPALIFVVAAVICFNRASKSSGQAQILWALGGVVGIVAFFVFGGSTINQFYDWLNS